MKAVIFSKGKAQALNIEAAQSLDALVCEALILEGQADVADIERLGGAFRHPRAHPTDKRALYPVDVESEHIVTRQGFKVATVADDDRSWFPAAASPSAPSVTVKPARTAPSKVGTVGPESTATVTAAKSSP